MFENTFYQLFAHCMIYLLNIENMIIVERLYNLIKHLANNRNNKLR